MLKAIKLCVNRQKMGATLREHVVEGDEILLSWGAVSAAHPARQQAFRVTMAAEQKEILDTGWVEDEEQSYRPDPALLPRGPRIAWRLWLKDSHGNQSEQAEQFFYIAEYPRQASWIRSAEEDARKPAYFRRDFRIEKPVRTANLYACGLGYHRLYLNGVPTDDAALDPAHTDYSKTCQYVLWPEVESLLRQGDNCIGAILGGGWRNNYGKYLGNMAPPAFFGPLQLTAVLHIVYQDGASECIATDDRWQAGGGPCVESHLYDGETYDANQSNSGWNLPGYSGFGPVLPAAAPCERLRAMTVPPIKAMRVYRPLTVSQTEEGAWLVDFGQNLAGVLRVKLRGLHPGQEITVRHAERLNDDGTPHFANLRGARQRDRYVASGDARDLDVWQPLFTYHGFRYALIEGMGAEADAVEAVLLHTDLENGSFFRCGSSLINQLQETILMTERDNMHSILTDCPQRDERMGWMNDATVRFEEFPYNFDCAAMFRKIARDIRDAQREDGAIACTAPKVYGQWPADPVCSSYLIAGLQAWLHGGSLELIREHFEDYRAWEDCLLRNSTDGLVNYSYYGDWAGPAYACDGDIETAARSAVTPGVFMSTGYSYYNCTLLSRFAALLGKAAEAEQYRSLAEQIRAAMLKAWYAPERKTFATGSMGCQTFALWLGIAPEADRKEMARMLRDDLVARDYRFTTGNLCTRYLLDVLAEYGYEDEAYALITREEYPSWGYMLQNEATTVWERFELKDNPSMNSYNHPMYGAVGSWLYAYLAGIRPLENGYQRVAIRPCFPKKLLSVQASVDTARGRLNVRWVRRKGILHLFVDVPFGVEAEVTFGGQTRLCGSGSHAFQEV